MSCASSDGVNRRRLMPPRIVGAGPSQRGRSQHVPLSDGDGILQAEATSLGGCASLAGLIVILAVNLLAQKLENMGQDVGLVPRDIF